MQSLLRNRRLSTFTFLAKADAKDMSSFISSAMYQLTT